MFRVTNISGGLLVCTLADGETTLRLKDGKHKDIEKGQMTEYLRGIEKRKLVKIDTLIPAPSPAASTPAAPAAKKTEKEA